MFLRFPGFKYKAVTLSYDDGGPELDQRLIRILSQHGMKGTFSLNSQPLIQNHIIGEQLKAIYLDSGNEIALHGARHLALARMDPAMAVRDVLEDRLTLEAMLGRIIRGMAYAQGSCSDRVTDIVKSCGVAYARTTKVTENFDIPEDWLRMPSTCHHGSPRLMELARQFIEKKDEGYYWQRRPLLFFVWGHCHEFERQQNWHIIESFADCVGGRRDVWYATNDEIFRYVQAYQRLIFSASGELIENPSATDVYLFYFGEQVLVRAGETVRVSNPCDRPVR